MQEGFSFQQAEYYAKRYIQSYCMEQNQIRYLKVDSAGKADLSKIATWKQSQTGFIKIDVDNLKIDIYDKQSKLTITCPKSNIESIQFDTTKDGEDPIPYVLISTVSKNKCAISTVSNVPEKHHLLDYIYHGLLLLSNESVQSPFFSDKVKEAQEMINKSNEVFLDHQNISKPPIPPPPSDMNFHDPTVIESFYIEPK